MLFLAFYIIESSALSFYCIIRFHKISKDSMTALINVGKPYA